MPFYEVTCVIIERREETVEVEAANEEEAMDLAYEECGGPLVDECEVVECICISDDDVSAN